MRVQALPRMDTTAFLPAYSQATALIEGLGGERTRWTEDSRKFADTKRRLVGDVALSCAFVGYCGPFNQEFRDYLIKTRYIDVGTDATFTKANAKAYACRAQVPLRQTIESRTEVASHSVPETQTSFHPVPSRKVF